MMFGMVQQPVMVQAQRAVWRSRWVASCLPLSEAALRRHPHVLDAIERVEPGDYKSSMDAAVACFLPELRGPMADFYAGRGQSMVDYPPAKVASYDESLASFVEQIYGMNVEDAAAVIVAMRAGETL